MQTISEISRVGRPARETTRDAPCRAATAPCPSRLPFTSAASHRSARSQRLSHLTVAADRAPRWEVVWEYLVVQRGFESTGVKEAKDLADKGEYVLVDVRPKDRFNDGRIPGAISVPLYQKTDFSSFSFTKYLRAVALLVNGVEPVELNPKFMEQLKAAGGGKGIMLYDEIGGTLEPTATFGNGKVSRSLLAVYQAIQSGAFEKVGHLRGGIYAWFRQSLPLEGSYDGSYAGRTPSVVEEKEFSYGRPPTLLETEDNLGGKTPR